MSLWRPEYARASIASGGVHVLARRGRTTLRLGGCDLAGQDRREPLSALQTLLVTHARGLRRLDLVVSDHFSRYFVFERVVGMRSLAELRMSLAVLFESRFGERAEDWQIEFDLPARAPVGLACALPRWVVDGSLDAARQAGIGRVAICPFFASAVQDYPQRAVQDGWFLARADAQVTLACLRAGHWIAIRTVAASADDEPATLVAREALRLGGDEPGAPPVALGAWPGASAADPFAMALAGAGA